MANIDSDSDSNSSSSYLNGSKNIEGNGNGNGIEEGMNGIGIGIGKNEKLGMNVVEPEIMLRDLGMTRETFIDFSLLCGTDFTERIPKLVSILILVRAIEISRNAS